MSAAPSPAPIDLAAMRARAEAATPGPWQTDDAQQHAWGVYDDNGDGVAVARDIQYDKASGSRYGVDLREADAIFIANAREDIPALLALVSRLEGDVERMREALGKAATDVLAERARQIAVEGWTPEHDDEHAGDELAVAAGCYAIPMSHWARLLPRSAMWSLGQVPQLWPWARQWWKPKDRRADLVRAGALILAEIERLDRAALGETT